MDKYFEENKRNMERQLEVWAFRIQHIAFCVQFIPNENGLALTKALSLLVIDNITPEEAWAVLHNPSMQRELETTVELEKKFGKKLPRWAEE